MGDLFSVKDPRGITVTCDSEQWYNHVATGDHDIMFNNVSAVTDTIQNPDSIFRSSQYIGTDVYFKQGATSTYDSALHTKVIVNYLGSNKGEVVTAFPTSKVKGGIEDEPIYKK